MKQRFVHIPESAALTVERTYEGLNVTADVPDIGRRTTVMFSLGAAAALMALLAGDSQPDPCDPAGDDSPAWSRTGERWERTAGADTWTLEHCVAGVDDESRPGWRVYGPEGFARGMWAGHCVRLAMAAGDAWITAYDEQHAGGAR